MIHGFPSQIYDHALLFSPSSSWLHKYYATELPHIPKAVKGVKSGWGTCSRTVRLTACASALSYWNNTIAAGCDNWEIIILDAITGSQSAILSGHTSRVRSVAFSSDGRSLVSGSNDKTVKLWDIQTGGVAKTFYGHTDFVYSACISADCTKIASGSINYKIYLWDIQTGKCLCTIKQVDSVSHVMFSPIDPLQIISVSDDKIWKWDINGHQIPPTYDGTYITFSPDHSQFAVCNENVVTVQNSDSREIVAKFHIASDGAEHCCFSPDGRFIAVAAGPNAYIWDTTSPDTDPIQTLIGHNYNIASLVFSSPSSLISASHDQSVKLWKIGTLSTDPVTIDQQSTLFTLPSILSVSLQARAGIAVSSDENGVVKTWDISTGLCKASFQTPGTREFSDAKLIDGRLVFVWYEDDKIHIWDTGKEELIETLDTSGCIGLRISEDGSRVFCLHDRSLQAWPMWTWEPVYEVELELEGELCLDSLSIDSSKVWVQIQNSSLQEGWDFGTLGSSPVPFDPSIGRPHLDFIGGRLLQTDGPCWIKDTVTGEEVFQLRGKYAEPYDVQWGGRYLVAGYASGEVLILDFDHVLSRDI